MDPAQPTANEIVRAAALAQPMRRRDEQELAMAGSFVKSGVSFGGVVFARTSWSLATGIGVADIGTYDVLDYQYRRGVWAGHCFDITTSERHDAQLQAMEAEERAAWRDISADVAREMTRMWVHSGRP
jgi:hypothetical protein